MPGLVPGIHDLLPLSQERRGWPGHRRAEATPSFGRLCPAMTKKRVTEQNDSRVSSRGRCSRSFGQVPDLRGRVIPKRWARCRASAGDAPGPARLRSGGRQASETAGRLGWPVAIRRASYGRVPYVRASGHDHPGRKRRCSLPTPKSLPPGSACAFITPTSSAPSLDEISSANQQPPARPAPISPLSNAMRR
jgi:hypothetical protein